MKPGSMWGDKLEARLRRYAGNRMIDEDRVILARVGPHAPCEPKHGAKLNSRCVYHLALRRDQESVTLADWLSRRKEQAGWFHGAKVYKR